MEKFTIETQGAKTYLTYQISDTDTLDSLSLGMLTNNKIKGIAPILFTQMDADKFLKYDITAKVPVSNFFAGSITKKRLLGVFSGITDGIVAAEEYMIDPSMFILDTDYIFVDVKTCETTLVLLPIENSEHLSGDMASFFKNIVFSSQYDQTESTNYVASIVSYLNGTTNFSLNDFGAMVKKLLNGSAQSQPVQPAPAPIVNPPVQPVSQPVQPKQTPPPIQRPISLPVPVAPKVQPPVAKPKQALPNQPFAIPNAQQPSPAQAKPVNTEPASDEEEISFFYLMQHYNKENKALYDAQKARKKAQKGQAKGSNPPPANSTPFAVPGNNQAPVPPAYQPPAPPPAQATRPQPPVQPMAQPQQPPVQTYPQQPQPQPAMAAAPSANSGNFGGTVVLNNSPKKGTTVLGKNPASQQSIPHLIRTKNNERINLSNGLLRMGRDKSLVEYCIGDNDAVSSYHADFSSVNGEYFVTDMNSTNHTYVDGVMIQSMKAIKLSHGTKIKLANEEFEFRMQ